MQNINISSAVAKLYILKKQGSMNSATPPPQKEVSKYEVVM